MPHILLSEEAVVKDVAEGAMSQVVAKPCTGRLNFFCQLFPRHAHTRATQLPRMLLYKPHLYRDS